MWLVIKGWWIWLVWPVTIFTNEKEKESEETRAEVVGKISISVVLKRTRAKWDRWLCALWRLLGVCRATRSSMKKQPGNAGLKEQLTTPILNTCKLFSLPFTQVVSWGESNEKSLPTGLVIIKNIYISYVTLKPECNWRKSKEYSLLCLMIYSVCVDTTSTGIIVSL